SLMPTWLKGVLSRCSSKPAQNSDAIFVLSAGSLLLRVSESPEFVNLHNLRMVLMQEAHEVLVAWGNYYVIIGSAGAALTGLQFVVMALVANSSLQSGSREISAFGTPTIVHFCAALLISAILSAPWRSLATLSLALGSCGLLGVIYGVVVVSRAISQSGYQPVWQDWGWHSIFPMIAYAVLL